MHDGAEGKEAENRTGLLLRPCAREFFNVTSGSEGDKEEVQGTSDTRTTEKQMSILVYTTGFVVWFELWFWFEPFFSESELAVIQTPRPNPDLVA